MYSNKIVVYICVDTQLSKYVYISYLTVCVSRECDDIWLSTSWNDTY
jgi:hypothetical protein